MTASSLSPAPVLPTRRDEAWRYAPHRALAELSFGPPSDVPPSLPADLVDSLPSLDGPLVVVVNGAVDTGRSRLVTAAGGATVTASASTDVLSSSSAAVAPLDGYVVLNVEHARDGAVIEIEPGVHLDAPVHVVDVAVPEQAGRVSCSRTTIRLGAGSSATVVETRVGVGTEPGGSSVHTAVSLGEGAVLEHVVLQDLPATQVHLGRVDVEQSTGASYRYRSFNLGASYGRLECHVALNGPGGRADLGGLFFGTGDQTLDQQITVVHDARDSVSRQTFRGVLDDQSTGVFNGGIDVRRGADGTDAAQSNHNLLLSTRAEVNTQPRLEILADEVACTHGATVGQLDEAALYYLRSRGIPTGEARRVLINGFADEIVDQVQVAAVRDWLSRRLGHDDE